MQRLNRDIAFIAKALFATFLIVFTYNIGKNSLIQWREENADPAEVQAFTQRIQPVRPADVSAKIAESRGRPVLVYVYASWCGACRVLMPRLMRTVESGKTTGIELVFISLDNDYFQLGRYLVGNNYDALFPPYLLQKSNVGSLNVTLNAAGMRYRGGIPYLGLLDASGNMVQEMLGAGAWYGFRDSIERVNQPPPAATD